MKRNYTTSVLLLICSILFFACKKKDSTPPPPAGPKTYLKSIAVFSNRYNFSYDAQNRLSRVDYVENSSSGSYTVTAYDANNNITEYILRTGTSNVRKSNSTFDAQNRITRTEVRDSVNPTTFTLANVTTYAYSAGKIVSESGNASGFIFGRSEYAFNSAGNITEQKFYNNSGINSGVPTSVYTYTTYDDKKTPESLMPYFLNGVVYPKNNYKAYSFTNSAGSTTNFTATHTYNNEGYPLTVTFLGGVTGVLYSYTYETR